jgi:orotate phosphoribosyltransferase
LREAAPFSNGYAGHDREDKATTALGFSNALHYQLVMTTQFLDKKTIAELTARMYLDTGAVRFMEDKPFIFTSGWASPVYNDSRWLISFPDVRSMLMDFTVSNIKREIGSDKIDAVAGGETAGIPFAAWVADRLALPMQYIRKKPKGFGRNAQIEGQLIPGQRVLLVEDLATDGRSKINFVKAIREAGGACEHCTVLFFYDIYAEGRKILADIGVTLHYLTTWHDVLAVAKASKKFDLEMLAEVEKFIHDPSGWSKAHGGLTEIAG